MMKSFHHCLHLSRPACLLLPLAATILAVAAPAVRADEIRVCPDYGVVRDRNDHEALLLPRRSVAHCARSYQTLYQTYRVLPESQAQRRQTVVPDADRLQSESSAAPGVSGSTIETAPAAPAQ